MKKLILLIITIVLFATPAVAVTQDEYCDVMGTTGGYMMVFRQRGMAKADAIKLHKLVSYSESYEQFGDVLAKEAYKWNVVEGQYEQAMQIQLFTKTVYDFCMSID